MSPLPPQLPEPVAFSPLKGEPAETTSEPEIRGQYERCGNLVYFDPSCEAYGDFVAIKALVAKGLVTDWPSQPTRLGWFGLNHHAMMSMQAHVKPTAIIAWVVQRACRAHPE